MRYSFVTRVTLHQVYVYIVRPVRHAALSKFSRFDKGDVIYTQGSIPKAFYIVLHGCVRMTTTTAPPASPSAVSVRRGSVHDRLTRRVSSVAATLEMPDHDALTTRLVAREAQRNSQEGGKGDDGDVAREVRQAGYFGEVGVLLPNTPCIATATAGADCTLLEMDSAGYLDLIGTDENLLAEMQLKLLREEVRGHCGPTCPRWSGGVTCH